MKHKSNLNNFGFKSMIISIRFCVYGMLLLAGEVFFYNITKIFREIPLIKYFFTFNWKVDPILHLDNVWQAPIISLFGQASLYMFIVYGLISIAGLEPMYRVLKKSNINFFIRAFIYMSIILFMEAILGWILFLVTGLKIWYYDDWGSWPVFTSFAISPVWYILGLITEFVIGKMDFLENAILYIFKADVINISKKQNANKVAIIKDTQISFKNKSFGKLNIILNKIAYDENINVLILDGNFFDSWNCGIREMPFDNAGQIVDLWKNGSFMPALKNCIEKCKEVLYIPGKYDADISQRDLNKIVSDSGKTMILKNSINLIYQEIFKMELINDKITNNSNNSKDIFNYLEKQNIKDSLYGFSFAYFLTRLKNETNCKNATKIYFKTLKEAKKLSKKTNIFKDKNIGQFLVPAIINSFINEINKLRDKEKITDKTQILMPQGFTNVTIAELKQSYFSIFDAQNNFTKKDLKYCLKKIFIQRKDSSWIELINHKNKKILITQNKL